MPDALGYRLKCGVVIPSTGTVVEAELNRMAPPGVTIHAGRMFIERPAMDSDAGFEALLDQVRAALDVALRDVLTCEPDCVIMGMSAETFWGGVEGNARFVEEVRARWGLEIVSPAAACRAALERLGVRRVALLSPYPPKVDEQVTRYFTECGFEVTGVKALRLGHARAIADTPEAPLRQALREMAGPGADAIVQVGMNLPFARLADEAERWLEKPVLALNAVSFWHALRRHGIDDRVPGWGSLLREH